MNEASYTLVTDNREQVIFECNVQDYSGRLRRVWYVLFVIRKYTKGLQK